jgi:hypothetical protein
VKPITDVTRLRLLVELHRQVAAASKDCVAQLTPDQLVADLAYRPGVTLTPDEKVALAALRLNDAARTGLVKLVADAAAAAFVGFFCVMDGVGDPADADAQVWLGVQLAEPDGKDHEMLHDAFFESYWDYAESGEPA